MISSDLMSYAAGRLEDIQTPSGIACGHSDSTVIRQLKRAGAARSSVEYSRWCHGGVVPSTLGIRMNGSGDRVEIVFVF